MIVTKNGDIYIAKGDRNSISLHKMDMPHERSYLTYNYPKGLYEWRFGNDDFSSFTNLNLKYLAAIDEKYIHELSKDMFETKNTLSELDKSPNEITYERWIVINQYEKAKEKGLRYRRNENNER